MQALRSFGLCTYLKAVVLCREPSQRAGVNAVGQLSWPTIGQAVHLLRWQGIPNWHWGQTKGGAFVSKAHVGGWHGGSFQM